MTNEHELLLLTAQLKTRILSKKDSMASLIDAAQSELGLTLVPVVIDPVGSSLIYWGKNDDPTPGTIEQLVLKLFKLKSSFKHRQLLTGTMNEVKDNRLYVNINYLQRTLFIARI